MFTQERVAANSRSLMQATAELLATLEDFNAGRVSVAAVMKAFASVPNGLIAAVVEFRKRGREPFLPVSNIGGELRVLRNWLKWPLERILVRRRAAQIRHPLTGELALAFPLVSSESSSVVIAVLADRSLQADERAFISALEHLRTTSRYFVREEDDSSESLEPSIVALGPLSSPLAQRAKAALHKRGWQAKELARLGDLWDCVHGRPPDAVLLDGKLFDVHAVLRAIRMKNDALRLPVIVFSDSAATTSELQMLADAVITPGATDHEIFVEMKRMLRTAGIYRAEQLEVRLGKFKAHLRGCRNSFEMAALAAEAISSCLGGWASVHLIDSRGRIASCEHGVSGPPVFTHVPETLLQEGPAFVHPVTANFARSLTMHEEVADAFLALESRSAASIPLVYRTQHIGTLVVATFHHAADAIEWRFVTAASEELAEVFGRENDVEPVARPELVRSGHWNAIDDHPFTIQFCNGFDGDLCWRFVRIDESSMLIRLCKPSRDADAVDRELVLRAHTTHSIEALLTSALGDADAGMAAVYSVVDGVLTYVCRGTPEPLVGGKGPLAIVDAHRNASRGVSSVHLRDDAWVAFVAGDTDRERFAHGILGASFAGIPEKAGVACCLALGHRSLVM